MNTGAGVILPQPDITNGAGMWTEHGFPLYGKHCTCERPCVLSVSVFVCVIKHFRERRVADERQQELLNKVRSPPAEKCGVG